MDEVGDDVLDGGKGHDRLKGGLGNDTFIVSKGTGDDVINDFVAGGKDDRIDVSNTKTDFKNLQDIMNAAQDIGFNCKIDLGGGDSLFLDGINEAQLANADFIF